jgi:hypothetical protein
MTARDVKRYVSPYAIGTESCKGLCDVGSGTEPDSDEGPFYVLAFTNSIGVTDAEVAANLEREKETVSQLASAQGEVAKLTRELKVLGEDYGTLLKQSDKYEIALSRARGLLEKMAKDWRCDQYVADIRAELEKI